MFQNEENDRIDQILKEDASDIKLDEDFLEKSFERLQAKMSYKKNIKPFETDARHWVRWSVSFAAAAAAFVLVFTPVYYATFEQNFEQPTVPSAVEPEIVKPIAKNDVIMNSDISTENLKIAVRSTEDKNMESEESEFNDSILKSQVLAEKLGTTDAFTSTDVFKNRVDVPRSDYDFQVVMPGVQTVSNGHAIRMPKNFISGR